MGLGIGASVVEVTALFDEETKQLLPNPEGKVSIKLIPGRRIVPITVEDGEITECAVFTLITGGAKCLIYYLRDDEYYLAIFTAKGKNGQYVWDWVDYSDLPTKAKKDTPLFQIWKPNITEDDEIDTSVGVSVFANALVGNPVSKHIATNKAEKILEDKYSDKDFEIEKIVYSFKDGYYHVFIKSPSSIDSSLIFCLICGAM